MKKLIFVFLIASLGYGQDFLGEDINLMVDQQLRIKELPSDLQRYGYDNFFRNIQMTRKFACCRNFNSRYEKLVGLVFIVKQISPYENRSGDILHTLKLEHPTVGVLYYKYDSKSQLPPPFELEEPLNIPNNYYCKDIAVAKNKFTQEIVSRSKFQDGISIMKREKDSLTSLYLSIKTLGVTQVKNKKGVTILLENDHSIEKPQVKLEVVTDTTKQFAYSALVPLTALEVQLLLTHKITKTRLYIFDNSVKNSRKLMDYLKCLTASDSIPLLEK